jgi:3-oxoacid CoA-transferase A subunit
MINKVVASVDEAVADMQDGSVILVGGFGTIAGMPTQLLTAVSKLNVKNLTVVSNNGGFGIEYVGENDIDVLHKTGQIKRQIVSAPVSQWIENRFEQRFRAGEIDIEMTAQGTLAERIRAGKAGLGGVLTPVGIGTVLEKGKQIIEVNGKKFLLELAIKADYALIRAYKADRYGNLIFKGNSRTFNATMAGAARVTIAEVEQVVELGELKAEEIVTPAVFVNRVVVRK